MRSLSGIMDRRVAPLGLALGLALITSLTFASPSEQLQLQTSLQSIDRSEAKALANRVRSAMSNPAGAKTARLALEHRALEGQKLAGDDAADHAKDDVKDAKGEVVVAGSREAARRRQVRARHRVRTQSQQSEDALSSSLLDDAAKLSRRQDDQGSAASDGARERHRERERARARLGKQHAKNKGKRLHALPSKGKQQQKRDGVGGTGAAGHYGPGPAYRAGTGAGPGSGSTGSGAGSGTGAGRGSSSPGPRR